MLNWRQLLPAVKSREGRWRGGLASGRRRGALRRGRQTLAVPRTGRGVACDDPGKCAGSAVSVMVRVLTHGRLSGGALTTVLPAGGWSVVHIAVFLSRPHAQHHLPEGVRALRGRRHGHHETAHQGVSEHSLQMVESARLAQVRQGSGETASPELVDSLQHRLGGQVETRAAAPVAMARATARRPQAMQVVVAAVSAAWTMMTWRSMTRAVLARGDSG